MMKATRWYPNRRPTRFSSGRVGDRLLALAARLLGFGALLGLFAFVVLGTVGAL